MNSISRDDLISNYKRELAIREYSFRTVKAYARQLELFLDFGMRTRNLAREERLKQWFDHFGTKAASRALAMAALKFFYHEYLNIPLSVFSMKRRHSKNLPSVLSKEEVMKLLGAVSNRKHRLMMALLYGSGLRVGELAALNVGDIDIEQKRIHIRKGKGAKDRYVVLPGSLCAQLQEIMGYRHGMAPLFVTRSNHRYRIRTIQAVFEKARRNIGLKKRASCHTLRHSFATGLMERGTDIRIIQSQLGHKNLKTTMVYTHISDELMKHIKSPLDD